MNDNRIVTCHMTVDEARAMLCGRRDCAQHRPEDKSAAWGKLARAIQRVTEQDAPPDGD